MSAIKKNTSLILHFYQNGAVHGGDFIGTPYAIFNKNYFKDDFWNVQKAVETFVIKVLEAKDATEGVEKLVECCKKGKELWGFDVFSRFTDLYTKDTVGAKNDPYGILLKDYKKVKAFLAEYYTVGVRLFSGMTKDEYAPEEERDVEAKFFGFIFEGEVLAIVPAVGMPLQNGLFDLDV